MAAGAGYELKVQLCYKTVARKELNQAVQICLLAPLDPQTKLRFRMKLEPARRKGMLGYQ